jgi:hypothetical protein
MRRRADISINTIVMAAIALFVLVILVFIFRDQIQRGNNTLSACKQKGGECLQSCGTSYSYYGIGDPGCKNDASGPYCCIPSDSILGSGSGT